jgi:hypothetical protein
MDTFDRRGVVPMLIGMEQDAFDSNDYLYEIKMDGIRCIAYVENGAVDLRNKRNMTLLQHVPELSSIYTAICGVSETVSRSIALRFVSGRFTSSCPSRYSISIGI